MTLGVSLTVALTSKELLTGNLTLTMSQALIFTLTSPLGFAVVCLLTNVETFQFYVFNCTLYLLNKRGD